MTRGAALHIEQRVVPGVADLAGEQAEGIDAGAVLDTENVAGILAREVGPVALRFETEDEGAALPAIANLAAGDGASRIMASLGRGGGEADSLVPALVRRTVASVGTDVEAAPIVDCGDNRRALVYGRAARSAALAWVAMAASEIAPSADAIFQFMSAPNQSINCDAQLYLWMRDTLYQPTGPLSLFFPHRHPLATPAFVVQSLVVVYRRSGAEKLRGDPSEQGVLRVQKIGFCRRALAGGCVSASALTSWPRVTGGQGRKITSGRHLSSSDADSWYPRS